MCRTGCPTQDHGSWGECVRASRIQWGDPGQRAYTKSWDGELSEYADARRQGVQPATTRRKDIRRAMKMADKTGVMSW